VVKLRFKTAEIILFSHLSPTELQIYLPELGCGKHRGSGALLCCAPPYLDLWSCHRHQKDTNS